MILTLSNPGLELAVLGNPGKQIKYDWDGVAPGQRKRIYQLAERWAKRKASGKFRSHAIGVRKALGPRKSLSGKPWSGLRGSVDLISKKTHKVVGTNPMRSFKRYAAKLNPLPAVGKVVTDVKALPTQAMGLVKNPVNAVVALGGSAVALSGGAIVMNRVVNPLIARLPAAIAGPMTSPMGKRVISASVAAGLGYTAAKFAPLSEDKKKALKAGALIAALVELIKPGAAGQLLARIPVVGQTVFGPAASMQGLGIYVQSPSYDPNGIDTVVTTPTGLPNKGIFGYVNSKGYTGIRPSEMDSIHGLPGMSGLGKYTTDTAYNPALLETGQTPTQAGFRESSADHFLARSPWGG